MASFSRLMREERNADTIVIVRLLRRIRAVLTASRSNCSSQSAMRLRMPWRFRERIKLLHVAIQSTVHTPRKVARETLTKLSDPSAPLAELRPGR